MKKCQNCEKEFENEGFVFCSELCLEKFLDLEEEEEESKGDPWKIL